MTLSGKPCFAEEDDRDWEFQKFMSMRRTINELTVEESHDTKVDSGLKAWQGGSDLAMYARYLRSIRAQVPTRAAYFGCNLISPRLMTICQHLQRDPG
ncbi:MAG: hypothetical protein ACRD4F_14765, partial [Candidatus Angelobacter sp.]